MAGNDLQFVALFALVSGVVLGAHLDYDSFGLLGYPAVAGGVDSYREAHRSYAVALVSPFHAIIALSTAGLTAWCVLTTAYMIYSGAATRTSILCSILALLNVCFGASLVLPSLRIILENDPDAIIGVKALFRIGMGHIGMLFSSIIGLLLQFNNFQQPSPTDRKAKIK